MRTIAIVDYTDNYGKRKKNVNMEFEGICTNKIPYLYGYVKNTYPKHKIYIHKIVNFKP